MKILKTMLFTPIIISSVFAQTGIEKSIENIKPYSIDLANTSELYNKSEKKLNTAKSTYYIAKFKNFAAQNAEGDFNYFYSNINALINLFKESNILNRLSDFVAFLNAYNNASNGLDYQKELLVDFDNETLICFTILAYVGQDLALYCRNNSDQKHWNDARKHFNEVMSILEENGLQELIGSDSYHFAIERLSLWLSEDVYKSDKGESYFKSLFNQYLYPLYEQHKTENLKNKQSSDQLIETEKQQVSIAS